jgi:hypothetical protein
VAEDRPRGWEIRSQIDHEMPRDFEIEIHRKVLAAILLNNQNIIN